MNEQMMNEVIEETLDNTVEVKPTLSNGQALAIGIGIGAVATIVFRAIVKKVKANKAKKLAEADTEVELSEDQYSEVE